MPDEPSGSSQKELMTGAWLIACVQIGAALLAHGVTSVLTVFVSPAQLLTAIAATLTFSGVWLYGTRRFGVDPRPVSKRGQLELYSTIFTAAGVLFGAWIITVLVGDAAAFYCEPVMPWRIEIAFFGSFFIGLLTRIAHVGGRAQVIYPLTLMALLWVAPFYGYFSGAIFLGINLIIDCADRTVPQIGLVAFGMIVGEKLGRILGNWITKTPVD